MVKKFVAFLMIGTMLLLLCACGGGADEVSRKMVSDIDALGEITLEDERKVEKLLQTYSTLTDSQKENVTNYATLLEAQDIIEELKEEQSTAAEADKQALLDDPTTQAILAILKTLKSGLKHPDTLKIYSVKYREDKIDTGDRCIFILVDYEAGNDVGGSVRKTDSVGVYYLTGQYKGQAIFYNRDDGERGTTVYNIYLSIHNLWLQAKQDKPNSIHDADVDFLMDNI